MTHKTTTSRLDKNRTTKAKFHPPTEAEIACCAYAIYAQENPQRALQIWREAEAQLMADRQHDAGLLRIPELLSHN
ncbi:MAG: hypothetical protein ACK4UN_01515 [Limisphaerales bacterium]